MVYPLVKSCSTEINGMENSYAYAFSTKVAGSNVEIRRTMHY